jgi:hypothetical protein
MSERAHGDTGSEIEKLLPLVIPNQRTASAHERERCARVIFHHVRVVEISGARAENSRGVHEKSGIKNEEGCKDAKKSSPTASLLIFNHQRSRS